MKLIQMAVKIFGLLLFLQITYTLYLLSPTSLSNENIRFVIPLDTNQEEIINKLFQDNFIRSKGTFNLVISIVQFPGTIEPGAYLLSHRMNTFQIAYNLIHNPYQKWAVLVPGLRVEQIAEKLKKKFNWNKAKSDDFLDNAKEGYMFPDTYLLNVNYSGAEFAQKLINTFNEKFDTKMQEDLLSQNVRLDTAVKIASLIERESGGDDDKALISGIIWNRLNKDMKLQIDATSQYIIGTPNDWWPIVKPSDHKIDSPFNTYQYKGLPPKPISNPSLASFKAAIYPQDTDCLYYLHDFAKQIHCGKTYEEHLENIEKYLR